MERVVVYGLLRRGEPLSHKLEDARFLGEVELEGFDMYHLGRYPGVVEGDGRVAAEVYEVDDLTELDRTEGAQEDPPLYERCRVDVDGSPAWIYLYARPLEGSFRIDSGDWRNRY